MPKHPGETQQQTADAVGCSRKHVNEVMNAVTTAGKTQNEVTPPEWITDPKMRAAFRKLPEDERERLKALPENQQRGAVRQAAIAAGILTKPTQEDICLRSFKKCSNHLEMLTRLREYYETFIASDSTKP